MTLPRNKPIGSIVRIRSDRDIAGTLDGNGCLDELPFMPEMVAYCGQKHRILRLANKLCVNSGTVSIRGMQDAVLLSTRRCDGSEHGGCQMSCAFIWKTAWLDFDIDETETDCATNCGSKQFVLDRELPLYQLTARQSKVSDDRYLCQATCLSQATNRLPAWKMGQYVDDVTVNNVKASRVAGFFASKLKDKLTGNGVVTGSCVKTPVERLDLKIGDHVQVKSLGEIKATLDKNGCNRGLWFASEMADFCGQQFEVTSRVSRLIDENDGTLRDLKVPSVVLGELACEGHSRRFCTRASLNFWREIWLRRV